MLTGIVKHFDAREGKGFGFITHEGQEVFFHQSFGGMMGALGGDVPIFIPGVVERAPKSGDSVLFEMSKGEKGWRATKWCFASTYLDAVKAVEARPTYRLCERRGVVNPSRLFRTRQATYHDVWEGKNLDLLRGGFPKDKYPLQDDHAFGRHFKLVTAEGLVDFEGDPR